jgi:hypothetical protein
VIFPLSTFRSPTPVPSLGGALFRRKPIIPIRVVGRTGSRLRTILVDSGADDVVFPSDLAALIGVDLTTAARRQARGVGASGGVGLLYAPVILELTDGQRTCRWRAVVAFARSRLRFDLLGIAGGIEHFRTTFDVGAGNVSLDPLPSLPVTQAATP